MPGGLRALAGRLAYRSQLRALRWALRLARSLPRGDLPLLASRTREIRRQADRVLFRIDERERQPLSGDGIDRPLHCDWAWRPELWRGTLALHDQTAIASQTRFGTEIALYHDCRTSEIALTQILPLPGAGRAPRGVALEAFGFDGSFLSLAIDLPADAARGLLKSHVVRVCAVLELERPVEIFARLNVRHGPNTEQIAREIPPGGDTDDVREVSVEFDLAYTNINEKRVERLWLDLIFDRPRMNRIALHDLTLSRRPRLGF